MTRPLCAISGGRVIWLCRSVLGSPHYKLEVTKEIDPDSEWMIADGILFEVIVARVLFEDDRLTGVRGILERIVRASVSSVHRKSGTLDIRAWTVPAVDRSAG